MLSSVASKRRGRGQVYGIAAGIAGAGEEAWSMRHFKKSPSHMSTAFLIEGANNFFLVCMGQKWLYRGGDVFGCHSLGKAGGKGGERNF